MFLALKVPFILCLSTTNCHGAKRLKPLEPCDNTKYQSWLRRYRLVCLLMSISCNGGQVKMIARQICPSGHKTWSYSWIYFPFYFHGREWELSALPWFGSFKWLWNCYSYCFLIVTLKVMLPRISCSIQTSQWVNCAPPIRYSCYTMRFDTIHWQQWSFASCVSTGPQGRDC